MRVGPWRRGEIGTGCAFLRWINGGVDPGGLGFALGLLFERRKVGLRFRPSLEDFLPVDGHLLRCLDAETDLIVIDPDDRDDDAVTDTDTFADPTTEYEHFGLP